MFHKMLVGGRAEVPGRLAVFAMCVAAVLCCLASFGEPVFVSFTLDGAFDMNGALERIFRAHGFRIGFAPCYTSPYLRVTPEQYKDWQAYGHEILIHGTYKLTEEMSIEEAEEKIKAASEACRRFGFSGCGYVASCGRAHPKHLPIIRKYFSYASTAPNRYADWGGVPYIRKDVDTPFTLWRYSLQLSTLEQMKAAVDATIVNKGMLMFYTHAESGRLMNSTPENVEALCKYLDEKIAKGEVAVRTPGVCASEFFGLKRSSCP